MRNDDLTGRDPAPDLARGLALALIAIANVMIYLDDRPYGLRQHVVEHDWLDRLAGAVTVTFVDGRAYPLFAALVGYGLVRIAERAGAGDPTSPAARWAVRRRSAWLIAFGFVHALIGFSGDVLGWYGLLGVVLAAGLGASDRTLLRLAAAWLVLASLVQGLLYSDPQIREQRSFLWSYVIDDPLTALGWRLVEWPMTPFGLLAVASPVLVGIWAARRHLLEHPERYRRLLRWTAAVGIGSGVVGGLALAVTIELTATGHPVPYPTVVVISVLHVVTGVFCGLGYLAFIALLATRLRDRRRGRAASRVTAALRATGRRSLSCYLAQTVVFVALLPAWTLGWGAQLSTAGAVLLALGTWVVTVLLADLAAAHGRTGPAEQLLRRLSRRSAPATTVHPPDNRATIG